MDINKVYDVIVIGGGHAGTEAALAASRMGAATLLLTQNLETIGQMSCNPAIGGIGKGHLVKEIDALGGVMARAIDRAGIQFRILNSRKGPAVRATRAQADRALYRQAIQQVVAEAEHLQVMQQAVHDLIVEGEQVVGVETQIGLKLYAKTVILTVGTFLGGRIHIGHQQQQGGRAGDAPANALAQRLRQLPFRVGRLKTGTPPRIDKKTIDFSQLEAQPGDTPVPVFSFLGSAAEHPRQVACHITHTNEQTHQIIRDNLKDSAMYGGMIEGVGPRYCPSIEDKVVRFAEKSSHQIFIEPEGLHSHEVYPNGISTSLPFGAQIEFVRSMKGFAKAHITRPGYAIEYDFFDPRDLLSSLETKLIANLFFAGQINGTTGYEEAAAQGLIAGLNAARKAAGQTSWSPQRSEAYIGVLIDDLITQGTQEPYRMFTSRAEYRLLLREDNADLRLTAKGYELGLVDDVRWQACQAKAEGAEICLARLESTWVVPGTEKAKAVEAILGQTLAREYSVMDLLKRPAVSYKQLAMVVEHAESYGNAVIEQVEIQAKYSGYIERQQAEIARLTKYETLKIPRDFNYEQVSGLSAEVKQKLKAVLPETIGAAARISGVTPAAVSLLLVFLKRKRG